MSQKVLFLVNTPYQLMVAVSLRLNEFNAFDADVAITDKIADYEKLVQRVREAEVFNGTIELQTRQLFSDDKKQTLKNRIVEREYPFTEKYDSFLFANLDHSASAVYRFLKKENKLVHAYMFEDGLATYSGWYAEFLSMYGAQSKEGVTYRNRLLKKWFHYYVDDVFCHVERMYLLTPEILTYTPKFEVIQMKPISYHNLTVVQLYNRIFGYDSSVDSYKEKVIFFEESYFADGISVNDVEMVGKIAEIIGKDNIFVKIHPRNPENRFEQLGYATNKNLSIPWEVIAMNIDLSDKILVSIASVAAIVPCTLLNKTYKGILLMKLLEDKSCLKQNITCLYEKICQENSNVITIPNTVDELVHVMDKESTKK